MEKQQSTVAVFAEETEIPAVGSKQPSKTLQLKQVLRAKGPVVIYLPGRSVSPIFRIVLYGSFSLKLSVLAMLIVLFVFLTILLPLSPFLN